MERSSTPNSDVVEDCLKDAGLYDHNLSKDEKVQIFKAINQSKTTATQEDEQRRILEQTEANCSAVEELLGLSPEQTSVDEENCSVTSTSVTKLDECGSAKKPFSHKTWVHKKKEVQSHDDTEEPDIVSVSSDTPNKAEGKQSPNSKSNEVVGDNIDALCLCCAHKKHQPLKIIKRISYYAPPYYCNPKLKDLSVEKRAQLIYEYHLTIQRKYHDYQLNSIFPAPWPNRIQSNSRFNGSFTRAIEKQIVEESNQESDDGEVHSQPASNKPDVNRPSSEEDFVVRAPNQQKKRKLYTEKSTNNEENKTVKKGKLISVASTEHSNNKTPPIRRKNLAPLKNEEIMKRSKLFHSATELTTHNEKIFDKLVEDEQNKRIAEKEMEKFQETLTQLSDEDNFINDNSSSEVDSQDIGDLVHDQEPFVTRRIITPPLTIKRKSRITKRHKDGSVVGQSNADGQKTVPMRIANRNVNKQLDIDEEWQPSSVKKKYTPLEVSSNSQQNNAVKMTVCPICDGSFPVTEIEEHAATCGLADDNNIPVRSRPVSQIVTITCETCDEVFLVNTDFEVHVQQCIARRLRK